MLNSLSYPLNQIIVLHQTSPKPGEPLCHSAGLVTNTSTRWFFLNVFIWGHWSYDLFHCHSSSPVGTESGPWHGLSTQHPTRHGKKKESKTSFHRRWNRTDCGVWTAIVAQKTQTGSDLDQDQIGSDLLSHFQEMALHCKKTIVTEGERDLKASESKSELIWYACT